MKPRYLAALAFASTIAISQPAIANNFPCADEKNPQRKLMVCAQEYIQYVRSNHLGIAAQLEAPLTKMEQAISVYGKNRNYPVLQAGIGEAARDIIKFSEQANGHYVNVDVVVDFAGILSSMAPEQHVSAEIPRLVTN